MKRILFLIAVVFTVLPLRAYVGEHFTYDGINYTVISEEDHTCATRSGSQSLNGSPISSGNNYSGSELILPAYPIKDGVQYTLVGIGNLSFYANKSLKTVVIPNTVISIWDMAFMNCSGLTLIDIPNTVISIWDKAFMNCSGLTSIDIPNSVRRIGVYAFFNCLNIKKVNFASIEALCNIDFAGDFSNPLVFTRNLCINGQEITNVVIPNTVTRIGSGAFYGCSGLTSIEIANTVTMIGDRAFGNCGGLTSIDIPNSVESIGVDAFHYCENLIKANFASIEALCNIDFANVYSNPLRYAHNLYINGEEITNIVIPNSVTSIGNCAFCGCSGLTSIEMPNSVTSIGGAAFYGCSGLTSIEIPNSVTSIGSSAFYGCSGLTSIEMPNSVTSIGEAAFYDCSGLTSIEIPNSVTSIGEFAFYGCSGVTSVVIPNSITTIDNYTFQDCSGLTSVVIPNSVTSIGDLAFKGCRGLTSLFIPNSVTSVGIEAFSGCSGLVWIVFGNGVKGYSIDTFNRCSPKYILKPSSSSYDRWFGSDVIYYDYDPTEDSMPVCKDDCMYSGNFQKIYFGMSSLSGDYVIPETVKSIGDNAFITCNKLASLVFPLTVTSVGSNILPEGGTFKKVAKPSSLNVSIGSSVPSIDYDAFDSRIEDGFVFTRNKRTVYFAPTQLHNGYRLPETVTAIGDYAFAYCDSIKSMEISNSVTSIGQSAFAHSKSLKSLSIGASVNTIGSNAWADCNAIETIVCRMPAPVEAPGNIFPVGVYDHATLYVPEGSKNQYMDVVPWSYFYNIEEGAPTGGVGNLIADNNDGKIDYDRPYEVYNLSGTLLNAKLELLAPGIYIVRQGKTVNKIRI